jgi:hypothetical protein
MDCRLRDTIDRTRLTVIGNLNIHYCGLYSSSALIIGKCLVFIVQSCALDIFVVAAMKASASVTE